MKRLLATTAILCAFAAPAMADFVAVNGVEFNMLNLNDNNNPVTTSSGLDADAPGATDTIGIATTRAVSMGFVSTGLTITTASGFATIKPAATEDWNTITFTPGFVDSLGHPVQFTSFSTRGQLESVAANVIITVDDNLGQQFVFVEPKDADWTAIGVEAVFGTGEFITSVNISTDDPNGFKEIKQETFGFATAAAVPAPIVGAGLPGIISACVGLWAFQRRRRVLNA